MKIRVDGPFGAPAADVFGYKTIALVAAGIGITPSASILDHLYHEYNQGRRQMRRVEVIWVCREVCMIAPFLDLLHRLEQRFRDNITNTSFMNVRIYLTQQMDWEMSSYVQLHSVGAARDPLTGLMQFLLIGRPNFSKVLEEIKLAVIQDNQVVAKYMAPATDVGVFFCGQSGVASVLRTACQSASGNGITFRFRKEQF